LQSENGAGGARVASIYAGVTPWVARI
jgi:hypothetical protein